MGQPWRSVKLTRVALRFIDPESLPIPFQVVGFSVRWWVNLSEQKWVNSGERYRASDKEFEEFVRGIYDRRKEGLSLGKR